MLVSRYAEDPNKAPENERYIFGNEKRHRKKEISDGFFQRLGCGCLAVILGVGSIFGAGYFTGKYFNYPQVVQRDIVGNENLEKIVYDKEGKPFCGEIDGLPVRAYVGKLQERK